MLVVLLVREVNLFHGLAHEDIPEGESARHNLCPHHLHHPILCGCGQGVLVHVPVDHFAELVLPTAAPPVLEGMLHQLPLFRLVDGLAQPIDRATVVFLCGFEALLDGVGAAHLLQESSCGCRMVFRIA